MNKSRSGKYCCLRSNRSMRREKYWLWRRDFHFIAERAPSPTPPPHIACSPVGNIRFGLEVAGASRAMLARKRQMRPLFTSGAFAN